MKRRNPKIRASTFTAAGPLPVPVAALTAGVTLDAESERAVDERMEALKGELLGLGERKGIAALVDVMLGRLGASERKVDRLGWRLLRALRYRFGQQSEKLSRDEIAQLCLALGGTQEQAAALEPVVPTPPDPEQSSDAPPAPAGADEAKKKRRNRTPANSIALDASVERIVTDVAVATHERVCALCDRPKSAMPPVEHERIEFVPAKVVVHVERREQLSCAHCRKDVSVAPHVTSLRGRRLAFSMHAKLLTQKCVDGMPLDRQRRELARMGISIPDKTIGSLWAYATDLLEPVALATFGSVLASPIVGADDSHLRTLDHGAKGGSFRGRFWCFVGTSGVIGAPEQVAFGYVPTWEAEEIQDWFATIDGDIQCDGYAGYAAECKDDDGNKTVAVPDARRLGCMMHVRSKFHAALLAKDNRAAIAIKLIGELYALEADFRARTLDAETRGRERRARSLLLLDKLDAFVDDVHPRLLPKSPLRIATEYARNQRVFVRRAFDDGRFEIDNGRTERRIRPFAMGRRSFLFTGSPRGGERLAIAYTLADNCVLLGIDPQRYFEDVLTKLERGWPVRRIAELMPQRWAAEHRAENGKTEAGPA